MSVTPQSLVTKYQSQIDSIITNLTNQKAAAIPGVISILVTSIVPSMMSDVGAIKSMSGDDKKTLVVDAATAIIDEIVKQLNTIPQIENSGIAQTIEGLAETLIPDAISLLIKVQNNQITFNKPTGCCG